MATPIKYKGTYTCGNFVSHHFCKFPFNFPDTNYVVAVEFPYDVILGTITKYVGAVDIAWTNGARAYMDFKIYAHWDDKNHGV
jgi:hypothetical protein